MSKKKRLLAKCVTPVCQLALANPPPPPKPSHPALLSVTGFDVSMCRQASDGDKSSSNTGKDGGRKSQPGPDDINSPGSDIKPERAHVE